jgi:hypothetical protein
VSKVKAVRLRTPFYHAADQEATVPLSAAEERVLKPKDKRPGGSR